MFCGFVFRATVNSFRLEDGRVPKTKKTDAQRLSAFSFLYPTHVACILLAAPAGARADVGSSLVHWEFGAVC